ncbi:hypothetical protein ACFX1Z_010072 [Malus domestica]
MHHHDHGHNHQEKRLLATSKLLEELADEEDMKLYGFEFQVSNLFSDGGDYCKSFSQLLAGAMVSPQSCLDMQRYMGRWYVDLAVDVSKLQQFFPPRLPLPPPAVLLEAPDTQSSQQF